MGNSKYSYQDVKNKFEERGYILLTPENEYINTVQKLKYICPKHSSCGELEISFSKLLNNRGCIYCGRERTTQARTKPIDFEMIRKICETHNFQFVTARRECGKIVVYFICNNHRDFGLQHSTLSNLKKCKGCRYCNGRYHYQYVVDKLKTMFPYYNIVSSYKNITTPITCYCSVHNLTWQTTPQRLLQGVGCIECGKEKLRQYHLHTHEEYADIIKTVNPDIEIVSDYQGLQNDIKVKCKKCGYEWTLNANSLRVNGTRCRKCSYTYKGEDGIIAVLKSLNILFIHQYRFEDCKDKRSLPFDFYLPDHNICIEFDGLQHYEPRFGKENFEQTLLHDKIKNDYCQQNNITLIRIPYWESQNIEKIIKQYIN